ncbi:MAG: hypothetical protein AAFR23_02040 [Pseudomonadota bacterium]
MIGSGIFVVRAVIADPNDRGPFDDWYKTEHMPDALKRFGGLRGWRCWSRTDPSVHTAYYMMPSPDAAETQDASAALKVLVADFDERWGDKVTRQREMFECVDVQDAG